MDLVKFYEGFKGEWYKPGSVIDEVTGEAFFWQKRTVTVKPKEDGTTFEASSQFIAIKQAGQDAGTDVLKLGVTLWGKDEVPESIKGRLITIKGGIFQRRETEAGEERLSLLVKGSDASWSADSQLQPQPASAPQQGTPQPPSLPEGLNISQIRSMSLSYSKDLAIQEMALNLDVLRKDILLRAEDFFNFIAFGEISETKTPDATVPSTTADPKTEGV